MAAIHELLKQVQDPALRARLTEEFARATQNKKFGLVFEEHMPECTPLYGIGIKRGGTVAKKASKINDTYTVIKLNGDTAVCRNRTSGETEEIAVSDLVAVAEFGEPIFPCLEHIDSVENAPDSDLWHTLIEADNYHALQLLEYLYPHKVDCIYIDPPYNTGARDWKYNNDYVDSNDSWRHSKWLSMMQKRLKIARRIINPDTGVIIVTIDEHEIHHLRMLLEQVFPEAYVQMATIVINQKGVSQGRLARTEEYAMFVFMHNAYLPVHYDDLLSQEEARVTQKNPRWERLLRGGTDSRREDSPTLFYPVYVDPKTKRITGVGDIVPLGETPDFTNLDEQNVAWPIRTDGSLGRWQVSPSSFQELIDIGYAKLGTFDKKRKTWTVLYLNRGSRKRIDEGEIIVTGKDPVTGVVTVEFAHDEARLRNIKTVWHRRLHDSGVYGSTLLSTIIGRETKFDFPKSIYSTKDAIAAVVRNKKDALIVDFFAGSGTTLNAVNLLNAEDNGNRKCILVTNNECSEDDEKMLRENGINPGDYEWEEHGVCKAVTWPRTKYSINGHRDDGIDLEGEYFTTLSKEVEKSRSFTHIGFVKDAAEMNPAEKKQLLALFAKGILPQNLVKADTKYIVSDNEKHTISVLFDDTAVDEWLEALDGMDHITDFYIVTEKKATFNAIKDRVTDVLGNIIVQEQVKRPMKEGFAANCEYFKLGFLDRDMVSLGQQFREILPLLWMKSGAVGKRPEYTEEDEPLMLILPENHFAVLVEEDAYSTFAKEVRKYDTIDTIYFVTNSESAYHEMSEDIGCRDTYQLYRDYIDNFVIGARRDRI